MAVVQITNQADRDFLVDHEQVGLKLNELTAEHQMLQTRADQFQTMATAAKATRDALGSRARSGMVRYKPGLDGILEAQLTKIDLVREDGNVIELVTNGG